MAENGWVATAAGVKATGMRINDVVFWTGAGAPAVGLGTDGELYFRSDGAALTTMYQKRLGVWVGLL
jgi:hypothetical protein